MRQGTALLLAAVAVTLLAHIHECAAAPTHQAVTAPSARHEHSHHARPQSAEPVRIDLDESTWDELEEEAHSISGHLHTQLQPQPRVHAGGARRRVAYPLHKIPHTLERRARAVTYSNTLIGYPSVVYSLNMLFGTPQQALRIIVDTGSANLAVATTSSAGTLNGDHFITSSSTTFVNTGGAVSTNYVLGSWSGSLFTDVVGFSSGPRITTEMAGITSSSGFFITSSSSFNNQGILGLAYKALANPHSDPVTPFLDTFIADNSLTDLFTMRLCEVNGTAFTRGGNLVVGGSATDVASLARSSFVFVNLTQELYYSVQATGISMGSTRLSVSCQLLNSPAGAIIDSGTSNLLVQQAVYDQIKSAFLSKVASLGLATPSDAFFEGRAFVSYTDSEVAQFDTITIFLKAPAAGQELPLVIQPWQYLRLVSSSGNLVRIWAISASCNTIFGVTLMSGYTVIHDRANKQLGFAPSTCDTQISMAARPALATQAIPNTVDISVCTIDSSICGSSSSTINLTTVGIVIGVVLGVIVIAALIIFKFLLCTRTAQVNSLEMTSKT
eukprot:m.86214 g.86214  ORF g.86214 m.86214 type:complete len:556 (+) comp15074_c0_seq1:347-2014(+)